MLLNTLVLLNTQCCSLVFKLVYPSLSHLRSEHLYHWFVYTPRNQDSFFGSIRKRMTYPIATRYLVSGAHSLRTNHLTAVTSGYYQNSHGRRERVGTTFLYIRCVVLRDGPTSLCSNIWSIFRITENLVSYFWNIFFPCTFNEALCVKLIISLRCPSHCHGLARKTSTRRPLFRRIPYTVIYTKWRRENNALQVPVELIILSSYSGKWKFGAEEIVNFWYLSKWAAGYATID